MLAARSAASGLDAWSAASGAITAWSALGSLWTRSALGAFGAWSALGSLWTWSALGAFGAGPAIGSVRRGGAILRSRTTGGALGAVTAAFAVSSLAVTARAAPSLGRVGHDHVRAGLDGRNEFDAFVAGVEGRRGLGRHHREDLDALHHLFDIGPIHVAHDRASGHQGCAEHSLREFCARGAPRCDVALQASDFDLNSARHRFPI